MSKCLQTLLTINVSECISYPVPSYKSNDGSHEALYLVNHRHALGFGSRFLIDAPPMLPGDTEITSYLLRVGDANFISLQPISTGLSTWTLNLLALIQQPKCTLCFWLPTCPQANVITLHSDAYMRQRQSAIPQVVDSVSVTQEPLRLFFCSYIMEGNFSSSLV